MCGLQTHLFLCATDPMFEVPIHFRSLSSDDQTFKHALIITSCSARDSFFPGLRRSKRPNSRSVPSSAGLRQLSAAVGRGLAVPLSRVSRFEGRHCPPLCCPWLGLNGAFDGQTLVSQRSRPGPEQRSAGHGSHTWQVRLTTCHERKQKTLCTDVYCKWFFSLADHPLHFLHSWKEEEDDKRKETENKKKSNSKY